MIEEGFVIIEYLSDDTEMMEMRVRCRECEHVFDVNMFILKPKNCVFDLGKSFSVVCPNCKSKHTTTLEESKIQILEKQIKATEEFLETVPNPFEPFMLKDIDTNELLFKMYCLHCEKDFSVYTKDQLAEHLPDPEELTVTCDSCQKTRKIKKGDILQFSFRLIAEQKVKNLRKELDELKGTKHVDNTENLQAE